MSQKTIGDALKTVTFTEPEGGWEAREAKIQADEAKRAQKADFDKNLETRRRLADWGVPAKDIERVVLGELQDTKPFLEVRAWEARENPDKCILVLAGSVGCGKTTAAAWWLSQPGPNNPYIKTGEPLFLPTFRMERMSRYSDKDMNRIEKARRLVIDDIGTEFSDTKGNFLALVRGLIDARYADRLPLLITTNLTAADFVEQYGARTVSRLYEVGRFREIQADDMRIGKK